MYFSFISIVLATFGSSVVSLQELIYNFVYHDLYQYTWLKNKQPVFWNVDKTIKHKRITNLTSEFQYLSALMGWVNNKVR